MIKYIPINIILLLLVHFFILTEAAMATNPIFTNRFTADPSAHDFNGRVYVYVTDDSSNTQNYWDSKDWWCYSSADMVNWTDHGAIFSLVKFGWSVNYAWAPTAISRSGKFYLYLPVDRTKIGVAVSSSPAGPFADAIGSPLVDKARDVNAGDEPIDPTVFTDDDGQAYLYFGSRTLKIVKLTEDMIHMSGEIADLTATNFAEAAWIHKCNGVYYLSYSTGWPGQIVYSTAKSPMGPFTYRGVILDYIPNINTNHASIMQFNGQWYIFYHNGALPGSNDSRRSVCVEYLYYSADGTIKPVNQTTTGVGPAQTVVPTAAPTQVPAVIKGDVNSNGVVDIVDALLIAQSYVGLNPANFNPAAADVNCSDAVDIIDALLVAQRYVGLVADFPC